MENVETLKAWLTMRGLTQFEAQLADLGVAEVDDVSIVEREDLEVLGFEPAQIAVFFGESKPEPKDVKAAAPKNEPLKEKVAASGKRVVRKGTRKRTKGFAPQQVSLNETDTSIDDSNGPALGDLDDEALNHIIHGSSITAATPADNEDTDLL